MCKEVVLALVMALAFGAGCDRKPSSSLKGQINTPIRFYGIVVDQDGKPLPNVVVEYQVDAYPKDWTYETRGRPYDTSFVSATSGNDGRFQFDATGCILRLKKVELTGYRHLWETNGSSVVGYSLIAWEEVTFKMDASNPAIFVLVKDGVREVSALPCKGGAERNGKGWKNNKPEWPKFPSLKDVVYKPVAGGH